MMRWVCLSAGLAGVLALSAPADDAIPPETLVAVKRATVFVQVQGPGGKGSGSGFVVHADKDVVLVATNHHVLDYASHEKNNRPSPADLARTLKQVKVSVVFDSGTKAEVTAKAEPIAADFDNDLAILRVSGLKEPPTPIDYKAEPKLIETMPVYTFGFPFGQALSTSKGSPAITVGKGAVSSIRNDDTGAVALVQIDGAINPGNSGGPVVDNKGQLVGVAVSRLKDGQGIGFAVPAVELVRLMKGRLCGITAAISRTGNKTTVRAEVEVADPAGAVRAVTLHYLVLPRGVKPTKEPLEKQTGAKKIALKTTGGIASGELTLDALDGSIFLMAVPDGGAGTDGATVLRGYALAVPKGSSPAAPPPGFGDDDPPAAGPALGAKPPPGWKEYTPKDKTYTIWIPDRGKQTERERSVNYKGQAMKFNTLTVDVPNGPDLIVSGAIFEGVNTQADRAELEEYIRDMLANEIRGRVVAERNVKLGAIPGKEYFIESGRLVVRVRIFVSGNWLLMPYVLGTRDMVDTDSARLFMDSCRVPTVPRPGTGPGGASGVSPDRLTKIQGGFNDPEFLDESPAGGLMVGVEVGIGTYGDYSVVRAARPIYRVGDKEMTGTWHGPVAGKEIQKVVAKPGYAVGAITIKNGLTIDGFSLTFMRFKNGGLDPNDSYESQWLGGKKGGAPVKLGDGTVVVGLTGKAKTDALSGLGLLYVDPSQPPTLGPTAGSPIAPSSTPTPEQPGSTPPRTNPPPKSDAAQPAVTTPTAPPASGDLPKEGKSNTALIVGVVAGAVVCLGAIGGVVFVLTRRGGGAEGRRRRSRDRDDDDDDDDDRPRRRNRRGPGRGSSRRDR